MVDSVLDFSRIHCVAICSVLVPFNLLTTIATIALTALGRSTQVWKSAGVASLGAGIMVLHVLTWFLAGVVMLPTYILLLLGSVCLTINLWAVLHPSSMRHVLTSLGRSLNLKHRPQSHA